MRVLKKITAYLMTAVLMLSILGVNPVVLAADTPTDLLFSEYIEGSSSNKALEIYNGTGADVDLSAYTVVLYSNGNTTPGNTAVLTGSLSDSDVYVIANSGADAAILAEADTTSTVCYFNGNDCVVLYKDYDKTTDTGTVIDSIGKIGGNIVYSASGVSTENDTLQRVNLTPDTDATNDFDPSVDWEAKGTDNFDYIGIHPGTNGDPVDPDPVDPDPVDPDPVDPVAVTITEVIAANDGDAVLTTGIVTSLKDAFIQEDDDDKAGINLYSGDLTGVNVGDMIKVSGTRASFKGLDEIKDFTVEEIISTGNALPAEITVTPSTITEADHEGKRVVVENVTITAKGNYGDYTAVDDGGNEIQIDPQENSLDDLLEIGTTYSAIHGIARMHYDALEIMPVDADDIVEAPLYPGAVSITDARAAAIGDVVITVGIVTCLEGRIFIQEDDADKAGINLYTGDVTGLNVGDQIAVEGTRAAWKGLDELENFTVLSTIATDQALPGEIEVTPSTFTEADHEAKRVVVRNITITAKGNYGDYTAVDGDGNEIQIDPQDSNLDALLEIGTTYDAIHGIGMMHYDALEIMPTKAADIEAADVVDPVDPVGNYYDGTEDLEGPALKAALNTIISTGHTPISYSAAYSALETTDEDPNIDGNIILFYKGISVLANDDGSRLSGDGDIWNREHVWAKSHGDFGTATGPGSDLHQLRPTDASVNSSRGHLDFDESDNPLTEAPANSIDDDSFEPRDEVKGDVARILFYMATRYEGGDGYVDLELSNSLDSVSATTSSYGEHGVLDTLLVWHEADPVDAFELARNTKVQDEQGNRNPFVDHPEFVALIWGEGADPTDPTDPATVIDISAARAADENTTVTVEGVVTHDESSTLIYIQDSTGGIKVDTYGKDVPLGEYNEGDVLQVTGAIEFYKGEMEISVTSTDDIVKNGTADLPAPVVTTIAELKAGNHQGELVTLPQFKVTGIGKYSVDIVNIDGEISDVYHNKADNFDSNNYPVNDWFRATGIAAWYNDEQIKLRDGADMVAVDAPANPDAGKPVITSIYPANMSSTYEADINVSFMIEADENPIDEASLKVYHNDAMVDAVLTEGTVTVALAGLALGNHDMKVVVADTAGLEATSEWYFTVLENVDYDFYFGIPHSHSAYSDGKGTPTEAFAYAKSRGVDWMFLTDHSNWFDGVAYEPKTSWLADANSPYYQADYNETYELNKDANQFEAIVGSEWWRIGEEVAAFNAANDDFVAFRGFEMTYGDVGHLNVIDSEAYVEAKSQMRSLADFYQWVEDLSEKQDDLALASFNHPNWPSDSFYNQAYVPSMDEEISMMEVGNGAPPYSYSRSEEQFIKALDNGWHIAPTNGQDNHSMNWGDPDNFTAVVAKDLSADSIKEAVSNRRVYSTETRNLELTVKANGFWMGSVVNVKQGETLTFEIEAKDNEEPIKEILIMTNGGNIVDRKVFASPLTVATWAPEIVVPGGANWYMVKVIHEDGEWGTAAPIFTPEADKDVKFTLLEVLPEITLPGYETELRATVSNMGLHEVDNVEVSFYIGEVAPENLVGTDTVDNIPAGESKNLSVMWTPAVDGENTIIAKMTEIPGVTTVTEISKTITVVPANGKTVMVDGAHGNYDTPGGLGEFISLMRQYGYQVVVNTAPITASTLETVDVMVATQPRGGDYTAAEVAAIADFTSKGGGVMLSAKSNYSDDPTRMDNILEAMGSGIRFNDDNVYEPEDSEFYNGGMVWSVYSYNLPKVPSGLNDNMEAIRMFSSASLVDENGGALVADPTTGLEILLAGNESSYNFSVGKQTSGGHTYNEMGGTNGETIPMIAKEDIGSGHVVATGRHFFSDFEIGNDVSNTALTVQLVDYLAGYVRIKTIQQVRDEFEAGLLVEGDTVTVKGTAIVDEETLFDVIYIQDETSGVSLYGSYQDNPADVFEGTEVIATGTIEIFEGEMEIAYKNYATEVLYVGFDEVIEATVVTSQESMTETLMGTLIKTSGEVTEINEAGSFMMIDDGTGAAYVHIDGYVGVDMGNFNVGDWVDVTGIGSHGSNGPRIRVRYESDVVLGEKPMELTASLFTATNRLYSPKAKTVTFMIDLAEFENINVLEAGISYDTSVLKFKKAMNAEGYEGMLRAVEDDGTIKIVSSYIDPISSEEASHVIKLVFDIKNFKEPSAEAEVMIDYVDTVVAGEAFITPAKLEDHTSVIFISNDKFDVNLDGEFNIVDLSFAVAAYMASVEDGETWLDVMFADINGDMVIDTVDFSLLMREYMKR